MQQQIHLHIVSHAHQDDKPYLPYLKSIIAGRAQVRLKCYTSSPKDYINVYVDAVANGCSKIVITDEGILKSLIGRNDATLDDYAGSIVQREGCEWLITNPLQHLATTNTGKHLFARYWSKFLDPQSWLQIPQFEYELFNPGNMDQYLRLAEEADYISFDIETIVDNLTITCCGFTFANLSTGSFYTVVIPFDDPFNIVFARKLLASPAPKVTQNGKYDIAYLLRYNCPPTNWAFDTQDMFFSWYSEFPKRLDFIASYMLRDWVFWKSESKVPILSPDYIRYNAKDCFATAIIFRSLLLEMPQWAVENFKDRMPVNFPCIVAEATGEKIDLAAVQRMSEVLAKTVATNLHQLQTMVDCFNYNPNSPDHTRNLFDMMGCKDVKGTGKIPQDKFASRHPLNRRISDKLISIRKDRKLRSTYLQEDKFFRGRCFYVLNASGTDTGRLASKESHFWCGLQIHNIPRDRNDIQIKECFVADAGFYHGEADGEQAEARTTAYLSGDLKLIETVESEDDYHSINASRFFGIPLKELWDSVEKKSLNKPIRQLSKNVNHGTNYNMGANVLIDTMGIENVVKAKQLLALPGYWSLKQVAQFLLDTYDKAYPTVRGPYYDYIKSCVLRTRLLVGPTGWTRYCFGDPTKNKNDLNSYVAHCGQSLNAMWLNKGYVRVFNEVYLANIGNFKLGPQIHDSIKFQYRIGFEHLARQVRRCMETNIIPVKDIYGIERQLRIPVALKGESTVWSKMIDESKWSRPIAA